MNGSDSAVEDTLSVMHPNKRISAFPFILHVSNCVSYHSNGFQYSTSAHWLYRNHRRVFIDIQLNSPIRDSCSRHPTNDSWRVDEAYIRVKGKWVYLYRAVDSTGATIDFLLSAKRDAAAARALSGQSARQSKPSDAASHQHRQACRLPAGNCATQRRGCSRGELPTSTGAISQQCTGTGSGECELIVQRNKCECQQCYLRIALRARLPRGSLMLSDSVMICQWAKLFTRLLRSRMTICSGVSNGSAALATIRAFPASPRSMFRWLRRHLALQTSLSDLTGFVRFKSPGRRAKAHS